MKPVTNDREREDIEPKFCSSVPQNPDLNAFLTQEGIVSKSREAESPGQPPEVRRKNELNI